MVCRPPGSSVQGIVQVRIQEYITISSCACMLNHSVMSKSFQPHGLQAARLLCSRDCPGKNTGVHCHFLLQGLFPTQGSNQHLLCLLLLCLLHGQADSLPLSHLGSPEISTLLTKAAFPSQVEIIPSPYISFPFTSDDTSELYPILSVNLFIT